MKEMPSYPETFSGAQKKIEQRPSLEQPVSDSSTERRAEEGPIRQVFEYRDAEGRVIGQAELELDRQGAELNLPTPTGEGERSLDARQLRSFIWKGQKDGKPTEVDILALIRREGDVAFLLDQAQVDAYGVYPGENPENRTIVAPRPENPVDMAFFLHEFGHADQRFDERVSHLQDLYQRRERILQLAPEELDERLDFVAQYIPESQEAVAEAKKMIPQLSVLHQRLQNFQSEALALKAKVEGDPHAKGAFSDIERIHYLNDQISGVERAKQLLLEESDPYELILLPVHVLEIDASQRAVDWMEQIKDQSGSDLFAPVRVPRASTVERSSASACADSAEQARSTHGEALTTARSEVKKALETYHATHLIPDDTFED